jgi:hypothetical protein
MNELLTQISGVLAKISFESSLVTVLGIVLISGGLRTLKNRKVTLISIKGVYQGWKLPETLKGKDAKFIAIVDIISGLFFLLVGITIMVGGILR